MLPGFLDSIIKEGAQRLLQQALEAEMANFLSGWSKELTDQGKQAVVRNGHYSRSILSPVGQLDLNMPRSLDRNDKGRKWSSSILPPYMRRTPCLENLIPALYLKGVSIGNMTEALKAILGPEVNISPAVINDLKEQWIKEYHEWSERDLSGLSFDYVWVDAVYFNCKAEENLRYCLLVMIAADPAGKKHLLSIKQGFKESALSWSEMIVDLISRGLRDCPKMVIGDGALGIWKAVEENWSESLQQRCWIHKARNVLDKLPKSLFKEADLDLKKIYMAKDRPTGEGNLREFYNKYSKRYPAACEVLKKDEDLLFNYYNFPAGHWTTIRNTNVIESAFSTVRLRTSTTRGIGTSENILAMTFKLLQNGESHWKRLVARE